MIELPAPVLFGAAYYPEYLTSNSLADDMALMREAGFTVIRVGESTWSTWEPEDGRFDLDWLQPTLDAALKHGISCLLGTPTYAVPPWLARKYPEIAAESATGRRVPWGARQEMDYTHPAFRFHAERLIRAVVGRYRSHPAVIGYQVDNEPGLVLFHNRGVFQSFVDDLRHQFGDVETLNKAWGLVYWSHRLSTWADLWTPDGNTTPGYDLAWRRFQAKLTDEFIAWQAGIVRQYTRPDQFVTTCVAFDRPGVDDPRLFESLDIAAGNLYYSTQDAMARPPAGARQGWSIADVPGLLLMLDRVWAARQQPFLVTETNAGTIGGSSLNFPAYDGQWRQAAWLMVARGARMVEYWHWHSLPWGAETYWTGVLPHDRRPGRVYQQVAALGRELQAAAPHIGGLTPDARVGLVWSNASRWALSFQPPFEDTGEQPPHPQPYERIVEAFYRGAFAAGLPVKVIHDVQMAGPDGDLMDPVAVAAELPVVLAPALYVVSPPIIDWLRRYVLAGGHLVIGPRTAYVDGQATVLSGAQPAGLDDLAGVTFQEMSNLAVPVTVVASQGDGGKLALPDGAQGERWIECLMPKCAADALAVFVHPHFSQFAAVTSHASGAGRVTTVATVPNLTLARAILEWAAGDDDPWRRLNDGTVTVTSAKVDGGHLRVLHNWSWDPVAVKLPEAARAVKSPDVTLAKDTTVELKAWDAAAFLTTPIPLFGGEWTTPALRATPPKEGNGPRLNSPP